MKKLDSNQRFIYILTLETKLNLNLRSIDEFCKIALNDLTDNDDNYKSIGIERMPHISAVSAKYNRTLQEYHHYYELLDFNTIEVIG